METCESSFHVLAADNEGIDKNANVSQYELWTQQAVMKTEKAIGFISWATYELKNKERICNDVADMLARFAEYGNKGESKTGGFGVTRIFKEDKYRQRTEIAKR